MSVLRFLAGLSCIVLCMGCGNPHVMQITKPVWYPEFAHWPELDAVDQPSVNEGSAVQGMGYHKLAKMVGDALQDLQTQASSQAPSAESSKLDISKLSIQGSHLASQIEIPDFQERLLKLKESPIPGKFNTSERQTALAEYVLSWEELRKICKAKANPAVIYQQFLKLSNLRDRVRFVPGQTPPTGDAVNSYSGVIPYVNPYETKP